MGKKTGWLGDKMTEKLLYIFAHDIYIYTDIYIYVYTYMNTCVCMFVCLRLPE